MKTIIYKHLQIEAENEYILIRTFGYGKEVTVPLTIEQTKTFIKSLQEIIQEAGKNLEILSEI